MPKAKKTKSGRLTAAERAELSQVNKILKSARSEKVLSFSKSISKLNKAAKTHKNNRISERDYKKYKRSISNILEQNNIIDFLELLQERKKHANERRKNQKEIKTDLKKVRELLENLDSNARGKYVRKISNLTENYNSKNITVKELEGIKKQLQEFIKNFDKIQIQIDENNRKYAKFFDISESEIKKDVWQGVIDLIDEIEDPEQWYQVSQFAKNLIDANSYDPANIVFFDEDDLPEDELKNTKIQIVNKLKEISKDQIEENEFYDLEGKYSNFWDD